MEPDCFFQIWSSDPVPKNRRPIFDPPIEDNNDFAHPVAHPIENTKDQFEYLMNMFIEICNINRMNLEKGSASITEKQFFVNIKKFDTKVEKWNSDYPEDLHDFFVVRLVDILEVRVINYQRTVDVALAVAYTTETNFDGSTVAERAIYDSARAVKNASAIVDAALSDVRIAKTLIKK